MKEPKSWLKRFLTKEPHFPFKWSGILWSLYQLSLSRRDSALLSPRNLMWRSLDCPYTQSHDHWTYNARPDTVQSFVRLFVPVQQYGPGCPYHVWRPFVAITETLHLSLSSSISICQEETVSLAKQCSAALGHRPDSASLCSDSDSGHEEITASLVTTSFSGFEEETVSLPRQIRLWPQTKHCVSLWLLPFLATKRTMPLPLTIEFLATNHALNIISATQVSGHKDDSTSLFDTLIPAYQENP